jgi:hypothetical protein
MTGGLFRGGLLLLSGLSFFPLSLLFLGLILIRLGTGCGGGGGGTWGGSFCIPGILLGFRFLFFLSWFGGCLLFGGGFLPCIGMLGMGLSFIGLIWLGGFLGLGLG